MKISELQEDSRKVDLEATVIEKSNSREVRSRYTNETYRVADFTIEDETGTVKLVLWNEQIDQVNVDNKVKVENGYVKTFRGEIQLNIGKYGTLIVL